MTRRRCFLMSALVTAVLAGAGPSRVLADWVEDGTALCTASGAQGSAALASDGSGGAIVTWCDERSGVKDIYAQRVSSSGDVLWTSGGVALCTATGSQYAPSIISDGAGGAIVTWYDARTGTYDVYAQKVDASGVVQWAVDGVGVCTVSGGQESPVLVSCGAGGAVIAWQDYRGTSVRDIYVQRLDAAGTAQWSADGIPMCTASGNQMSPKIVSDGAGGAIVAWQDYRNVNADVFARRVDSTGTMQWAADGVGLCTDSANQYYPEIAPDGSGGAIVTWHDYRNGGTDVYAQRIDAAGTVHWTTDGVALCTAAGLQNYPQIVPDGAGGGIVVWADHRTMFPDIYAQRVSTSGVVQWVADGVALCTDSAIQDAPCIVACGGGAIVAWEDRRNGNTDIYAQRILLSGSVRWKTDGVIVSAATGSQESPQIESAGGGAVVTWQDDRSGIDEDIYAQRITWTGSWGSDPVPVSRWAVAITIVGLAAIGAMMTLRRTKMRRRRVHIDN